MNCSFAVTNNSSVYLLIQQNPGNSNSEGKRKAVRVSGELELPG